MQQIRVSIVSYLNSKPFVFGLEHSNFREQFLLSKDMPSVCAQKLIDDEVDIGLVPVAAIPFLKTPYIISDYCIGAIGNVHSVNLYSEVPIGEVKRIFLDYQSRTSVQLVQLLAKEHWKVNPEFVPATEGFEQRIAGQNAAVVIGDRTFSMENKHRFVYDLAGTWMEHTKLPFVFACWVSNKQLPDAFVRDFNAALEFGIQNRAVLIEQLKQQQNYPVNIERYLMQSISYEYDAAKKAGLDRFLKSLPVV